MSESQKKTDRPAFSSVPSEPRADPGWRALVYLGLLALACAAIWFIDRGAMVSNGSGK